MNKAIVKEQLLNGDYDKGLKLIHCKEDITNERQRYVDLLDKFSKRFDAEDVYLISAPGRTEVGGNHTDHQQGRVLAASVNMDIACVASRNEQFVRYYSDDFEINTIDISDLSYKIEERFTSEALIKGILFRFKELGYQIGGFDVYCHSEVLKGSGISSSAAFEVLIGTILNYLYNDGKIDSVTIAKVGQYAENKYFGKPCGLLDQMACATGGFVTIDFKDKENPIVEKINFDFNKSGHTLILVDTKGDHSDLSDEYGLMPQEMKKVANVFGKNVLSEITMDMLLDNIASVKEKCSDRSILRAIHFLNETERVVDEVNALKVNDFETFKKYVIESGYSSYMYLQNVYSDYKTQNLSLALALSEQLLKDKGAYRVHGGGLAGTIQAFVPNELVANYINLMEKVFGEGCCFKMQIRPVGGYNLSKN